jgi:NADPH:quinone reductase-like Zn-dependent oxidoreductase
MAKIHKAQVIGAAGSAKNAEVARQTGADQAHFRFGESMMLLIYCRTDVDAPRFTD